MKGSSRHQKKEHPDAVVNGYEESKDSQFAENWKLTWADFNRALRSPEPFPAFQWTFRLMKASIGYFYYWSGMHRFGFHEIWRPCVPAFALLLVLFVVFCYFSVLRTTIGARWCANCTVDNNDPQCQSKCLWPHVHDGFVLYFGFMIIFNFLSASLSSPGVVLSYKYKGIDDNGDGEARLLPELKWRSIEGQGGCCCIEPIFNIRAERIRLIHYQNTSDALNKSTINDDCFPDTKSTFCENCRIERPARSHHCRVCRRCILEFDHHCVWINNCVGMNNRRSFVLTLLFFVLGCWYGVVVLFLPFYLPLKSQISEHGFRLFYKNKTGILDIAPPWTLLYQAVTVGVDNDTVIKIVYPLLFFVGFMLAFFFMYHFRLILTARTTLEQTILLHKQRSALNSGKLWYESRRNPYNKGWYANLQLVMGPSLLFWFVPIPLQSRYYCSTGPKIKN